MVLSTKQLGIKAPSLSGGSSLKAGGQHPAGTEPVANGRPRLSDSLLTSGGSQNNLFPFKPLPRPLFNPSQYSLRASNCTYTLKNTPSGHQCLIQKI